MNAISGRAYRFLLVCLLCSATMFTTLVLGESHEAGSSRATLPKLLHQFFIPSVGESVLQHKHRLTSFYAEHEISAVVAVTPTTTSPQSQRSSAAAASGSEEGGATAMTTMHHNGYVIGVLHSWATMRHVHAFTGHDDAHFITTRHGTVVVQPEGAEGDERGEEEATVLHRHVLVYHGSSSSSNEASSSWLAQHHRHQHRVTRNVDRFKSCSISSSEGGCSPFIRVLRVPHPATSHLHPSLWPQSTTTSEATTRALDIGVTISESVLSQLKKKTTSKGAQTVENITGPVVTTPDALIDDILQSHLETSAAGSGVTSAKASPHHTCSARVVVPASSSVHGGAFRRVVKVRLSASSVTPPLLQRAGVVEQCSDLLAALSSAPFVRWVEPLQSFSTMNLMATVTMQNPRLTGGQVHSLWERGITGTGQLVAVGDTGLDYDSCFFSDPSHDVVFYPNTNPQHRKVFSYQQCEDEGLSPDHTDVYGGHGTHVSGSAAGNSLNGNQDYNGMAKDARIFFQDLTCTSQSGLLLPSDLEEYYAPAFSIGARVSSNSWGGEHPTSYMTTDRLSDKFLYEHQDYLVVVAAGNSPTTGILSPSTSKNVLSVGAHMNSFEANKRETLAQFSARGPTYDNRIKPDVTAPGSPVVSALSDGRLNSFQCSTTSRMGTSMATPHVAGSAVLLRQYLAEGYMTPSGGALANASMASQYRVKSPSAALMKALLIQAAVPMTDNVGTAPNGNQGYGRLELPTLMYFPPTTSTTTTVTQPFRWMVDRRIIRTGEAQSFCFTTTKTLSSDATQPPPVSFIRATLAWIDAASALEGSMHSLVNDLDLVIVGSDGTLFHTGNAISSLTPGKRVYNAENHNDNVEQVTLSDATLVGGSFRVMVYGYDIPDDARYNGQPFALSVWAPGLVYRATESECPATNNSATTAAACPNGCSGIGTCVSGVCQCPPSHHGIDCAFCNGTVVCHGNGVCTFDKVCSCTAAGHFSDTTSCAPSVCTAGWYGVHCDNNCQCGGASHGACDAAGVCVCVRPASDVAAAAGSVDVPVAGSSCYQGSACQTCCRDAGGPTCSTRSFWCSNRQTRIINASLFEAADSSSSTWRTGLIQIDGNSQYPNSQKCAWRVTAPTGWHVQLTFTSFQVEAPYDYVRVMDGPVNSPEHILQQPLTGTDGLGRTFLSSGADLFVSFFSDYVGPAAGFVAKYEFIEPPTTTKVTTTTTTTTTTAAPPTTVVPETTAATTTTTTAAPLPPVSTTTTVAPNVPTEPFSCNSINDCDPQGTARCSSDTHLCVCKSALYVGSRCELKCPTSFNTVVGKSVICNGKGSCPPAASSPSSTPQNRCEGCESGFFGNGCQLNTTVIDTLGGGVGVAASASSSASSASVGSSVVLLHALPYRYGQAVWPLPTLTVPMMSSAHSTSVSPSTLQPGSEHYFLLKIPAPTYAQTADSAQVSYAKSLAAHPPRLRIWVLRPNITSAPLAPSPAVAITTWTSFEAAGDFQDAAPSLTSPCVDYAAPIVDASVASAGTDDQEWITLAVAVRVPLYDEASQEDAYRFWFLHVEALPMMDNGNSATATLNSCEHDAQYLASYAVATAQLSVGNSHHSARTNGTNTVVDVTNQTTISSITDALSASTIAQAVLIGVVLGLGIGAGLAVNFALRHKGFRRADEEPAEDVDNSDDELEFHNNAANVAEGATSPAPAATDTTTTNSDVVVSDGELRRGQPRQASPSASSTTSIDNDSGDDEFDGLFQLSVERNGGGGSGNGPPPTRRGKGWSTAGGLACE